MTCGNFSNKFHCTCTKKTKLVLFDKKQVPLFVIFVSSQDFPHWLLFYLALVALRLPVDCKFDARYLLFKKMHNVILLVTYIMQDMCQKLKIV